MAKTAPPNKLNPLIELTQSAPEAALEPLKALARLYPSDSRVLYTLGLAHLGADEPTQAIPPLEEAAKRERQYVTEVQSSLAVAYSRAGMAVHAHRASGRAGQTLPPWQETLSGAFPEGTKLADVLEFESARSDLLQLGPKSAAATKRMQALISKFPTYLPAINIAATGAYLQGQFAQASMWTGRALEIDPHNVHALLNLARVERLLGGVSAVGALRPRVRAARLHDEDGFTVNAGELALADIYLLMEDARAARTAVNRGMKNENAPADAELTPAAEQILMRLERAQERPGTPLVLPGELLPLGWSSRWRSLPTARAHRAVESDMKSIPGWFENIETALLYESGERAQVFAGLLLNPEFSKTLPPDGVSAEARAKRFLDALRGDKGTTEGRLGVVQALQGLDLLPGDFALRGEDGAEIQHHKIELTGDAVPSPLTEADQELFEQAHELLRGEQYPQAIAIYLPLAQRYPDFASIHYNLALAEEQVGTPALRTSAQERLERLAREYPGYLFAPANLALQAVHDGDLDRAETLMAFPQGITRLHIQEYGYFNAVLSVIALHKGDLKTVEKNLDYLEESLGDDSMPYQMLRQETIKWARDLGPKQGYPVLRLITGKKR